jgi:hypothetical protein
LLFMIMGSFGQIAAVSAHDHATGNSGLVISVSQRASPEALTRAERSVRAAAA